MVLDSFVATWTLIYQSHFWQVSIKVDLHKAYDSVEWAMLCGILISLALVCGLLIWFFNVFPHLLSKFCKIVRSRGFHSSKRFKTRRPLVSIRLYYSIRTII